MSLRSLFCQLAAVVALAQSADNNCYECASDALKDNWEVTSLPIRPDKLYFDALCDTTPNSVPIVDCSNSACFEMLVPSGGDIAFVRGCYTNFINFPSNMTRTSVATAKCEYGAVDGEQVSGTDTTNKVVTIDAAAAMRFCGTNNCNTQLAVSTNVYTTGLIPYLAGFDECVVPTAKQCVSCSRYRGGSCDHAAKGTCTGAYCVKYEGHIADDWFEARACSPISPFTQDQCSWVDQPMDIDLIGATFSEEYKGLLLSAVASLDATRPSLVPILVLFVARILLISQMEVTIEAEAPRDIPSENHCESTPGSPLCSTLPRCEGKAKKKSIREGDCCKETP